MTMRVVCSGVDGAELHCRDAKSEGEEGKPLGGSEATTKHDYGGYGGDEGLELECNLEDGNRKVASGDVALGKKGQTNREAEKRSITHMRLFWRAKSTAGTAIFHQSPPKISSHSIPTTPILLRLSQSIGSSSIFITFGSGLNLPSCGSFSSFSLRKGEMGLCGQENVARLEVSGKRVERGERGEPMGSPLSIVTEKEGGRLAMEERRRMLLRFDWTGSEVVWGVVS